MKPYIYTAEVDVVAVKHDCLKFLEIFSQKYEVRILIFFKTFKDGIWYKVETKRVQIPLRLNWKIVWSLMAIRLRNDMALRRLLFLTFSPSSRKRWNIKLKGLAFYFKFFQLLRRGYLFRTWSLFVGSENNFWTKLR